MAYIGWGLILGSLVPMQGAIVHAQESYHVTSLTVRGAEHFSANRIKNQLSLRPLSLWQRVRFWKDPPEFSRVLFEEDVEGIKIFYQKRGFPDVHIATEVVPDHDSREVSILLDIREGEPVEVGEVRLVPVDSAQVSERELLQLYRERQVNVSLESGDRFQDALFINDRDRIHQSFMERGYPFAIVATELLQDRSDHLVDILYRVYLGPLCEFGEVHVAGNHYIPALSIQRQVTFEAGQIFSEQELVQTQRRIYQMGLFRYVVVRAQMDSLQGRRLPIQIRVREAPRTTLRLGGGYGREDRIRVFAQMERLGVLGRDRKLRLSLKHSYLEPYNVDLEWIKPSFIFPSARISINPFYRREREPGFTVDRAGSHAIYQQTFTSPLEIYIKYSLEQDYLNISTQTRRQALDNSDVSLYNKSSATWGFSFDSSTPLFFPRSGWYFAGSVSLAGLGFKSDFKYISVLFESRRYLELSAVVIATKFKAGGMKAIWESRITPIEERFYAGGSNSVRGWSRSGLGPLGEENQPLGGNSLIEFSLESRFPLFSPLAGVIFMDAGNVWRQLAGFRWDQIRYAVGTGLRYRTPIGPIRLDVGVPVFDPVKTPQLFISVGQSF
jgi:outer membrane protein insertion porin family